MTEQEATFTELSLGTPQYIEAVELRMDVLRRPLGLDSFPEEEEKIAHYGIIWCGKIVGTVDLQRINKLTMRMRQVAVRNDFRSRGLGKILVNKSEDVAKNLGCQWMIANARETAVGFYEKLGYDVSPNVFTEVTIPHREVRKRLSRNESAQSPPT